MDQHISLRILRIILVMTCGYKKMLQCFSNNIYRGCSHYVLMYSIRARVLTKKKILNFDNYRKSTMFLCSLQKKKQILEYIFLINSDISDETKSANGGTDFCLKKQYILQ